MMQGDSYGLAILIKNAGGIVITADDVADVEITIGFLKKRYSTGDVLFDSSSMKWIFPLTQEETFQFPSIRVKGQVRVMFKSGFVEGVSLGYVNVNESTSKEVL